MRLIGRDVGEHVWGTHNMGDDAEAAPFADVIGYTEAAPIRRVRRELGRPYRVRPAPGNRSLAIAWNDEKFALLHRWANHVHDGKAGVTPGRDTLVAILGDRLTGETYRVLVAHRINNAHGRIKRSHRALRERLWWLHYDRDKRAIRRGLKRQDHVVALADTNRANGDVFAGLDETANGYDRIGWSASLEPVTTVERLARGGSDHNRKRITLRPVRSTR